MRIRTFFDKVDGFYSVREITERLTGKENEELPEIHVFLCSKIKENEGMPKSFRTDGVEMGPFEEKTS